MRRELSKAEVERLFIEAIDESLPPADRQVFDAELETNVELKARFVAYQKTVKRLKTTAPEKAPDALASAILRRTRRRRFHLRGADALQNFSVPAEVIIPLLLAALVALVMFFATP